MHENFKASQLNFYGLSKASRKKNYFRKMSFFTYLLICITNYTIIHYQLHIGEHKILTLMKLILRRQDLNLNFYT